VTIQLHHVALTKAQLDAMPASERNFLVLLAHSANEIAVLSKLFHYCAGGRPRKHLPRQVLNVQAMLMGRLVTGKIFECWKILQRMYFNKPLQQKYHSKLDPEARATLDEMEKYFRGSNLIKRVRDKHAFHYDVHQIADGHRTLNEAEPLDVYLGKIQANTLYAFADVIAGRAMMECIQRDDPQKALNMLITETSRAIGWINLGTGALMAACFKEHIGGSLYALGAKIVTIDGAPNSQLVRIPYFIEVSRKKPRKSRRKK